MCIGDKYVTDEGPRVAKEFRARAVADRLGRAIGEALAAGLDAQEVMALAESACGVWPQPWIDGTTNLELYLTLI